ncbi:hypothetical protein KJ365_09770 [Glaciecola sp. XM2]|jgi:tetratricopeptide (TPR) repeat protein|uniref:hypothetical protein n=1 Tax=Glaciecola sp. XM2 TaxID=1914931 RepID=UPI001BDF5CDD|nr:hypothetical protein [Glaciecola sp. XM2]MBT1451166.1 hypothetical protein [Glaciecola sp. XM2]
MTLFESTMRSIISVTFLMVVLYLPFNTLAQQGQPLSATLSLKAIEGLFQQQQFSDVIKAIESIPESQRTQEHYRFLTYSLSTDDLDEAEEAAQRAIARFPNDPDVYLVHASIMGQQASDSIFSAFGYAKQALASLNKAVSLAPNKTEYRIALLSFHINAPSIAGGDRDEALKQVQMIQALDPIEGVINLAWYHRSFDNPGLAKEVLLAANQDFPKNINILNALATNAVHSENYIEAIEFYKQVTDIQLVRPINDEQSVMQRFDEALYRQLNAHYQIGRSALVGNVMLDEGVTHMRQYMETIQNTEVVGALDTSGLPSIQWAKLRLSGLLLANSQADAANKMFQQVVLDKNDSNMKTVFDKMKAKLD